MNDLLKKYPGETLRLSLISSHYRQPLNWNSKIIEQAQKNLDRIYRILKDNENISIDENIHVPDNVVDALSDDLNTSKAMFEINLIADKLSKSNNKNKSALKGELVSSGKILGLFQQSPSEWLKYGKTNNNIDSNFIEELILKRNKAREVKNFQEADKIRDELTNINIEIEDTIDGTIWRSKN